MSGEITLTREQAERIKDALDTAVNRYELMGAYEDGMHDEGDELPVEALEVESAANLITELLGPK